MAVMAPAGFELPGLLVEIVGVAMSIAVKGSPFGYRAYCGGSGSDHANSDKASSAGRPRDRSVAVMQVGALIATIVDLSAEVTEVGSLQVGCRPHFRVPVGGGSLKGPHPPTTLVHLGVGSCRSWHRPPIGRDAIAVGPSRPAHRVGSSALADQGLRASAGRRESRSARFRASPVLPRARKRRKPPEGGFETSTISRG
jgi:hypothetical protein